MWLANGSLSELVEYLFRTAQRHDLVHHRAERSDPSSVTNVCETTFLIRASNQGAPKSCT
jgi:hypothetical protein